MRVISDDEVEHSLQMVAGSASCFRGTVFVTRHDEGETSAYEVDGEYNASCRDIASALGRIFTSLSSVATDFSGVHTVKLFLSRLVYLDAFGCIDFTALNRDSLQIVLGTLESCFSHLRDQNYQPLQDWLKYPLKRAGVNRTDMQVDRSKTSMQDLRDNIIFMMKHNMYAGIMVVGLASETLYEDVAVRVKMGGGICL